VIEQLAHLDLADFPSQTPQVARVIDHPIRSRWPKVGVPQKQHRVVRLSLRDLVKENQVSSLGGADVGRDEK
jgi:hypothetical protein